MKKIVSETLFEFNSLTTAGKDSILEQRASNELDQIFLAVYGKMHSSRLFEADDDDDVLSTPISRIASFPARAMRYKKAEMVMNKYKEKLHTKIKNLVQKFIDQLKKTASAIIEKGNKLETELQTAEAANDQAKVQIISKQMDKLKSDIDKDQDARINTLNTAIDRIIEAYSNAINKRIDEPGFVLRVELSEKGKGELKIKWEEIVADVKQQAYEKLVSIINSADIQELEGLTARLQVEIDKISRTYHAASATWQSDPSEITDQNEKKIWAAFDSAGGNLDISYKIKNPSLISGLINSNQDHVRFIVKDNKLGFIWEILRPASGGKGRKLEVVVVRPDKNPFNPMSENYRGITLPVADAERLARNFVMAVT
jgi:hypothetical protein